MTSEIKRSRLRHDAANTIVPIQLGLWLSDEAGYSRSADVAIMDIGANRSPLFLSSLTKPECATVGGFLSQMGQRNSI